MTTEERSVTMFREYLGIKSDQPKPDYYGCISWLKVQATQIGLRLTIIPIPGPAEFVVILTWLGKNSKLKSIILSSHMCTGTTAPPDEITHLPFAANKDESGNIYGRGSQDMKSVGIQYLEAIRKLKEKGFVPLRNVHVVFVADEEHGGRRGMAPFSESEEFASLNVGFALDEGIPSSDESFMLYYAERSICQVKFTAKGTTGHSLIMYENTAAEKIQNIINKLLDVRTSEKNRLQYDPSLGLGDVTSFNMTMLHGGVDINIVPSQLSVSFDIRVAPTHKASDLKKLLDETCTEAGSDVSYEFILETLDFVAQTSLVDGNVWWKSFKSTCDNMGLKLIPTINPASTGMRYIRQMGIPCFGFTPINNHPVFLPGDDEYLNETTFLRGIDIYETILWNLANITEHP